MKKILLNFAALMLLASVPLASAESIYGKKADDDLPTVSDDKASALDSLLDEPASVQAETNDMPPVAPTTAAPAPVAATPPPPAPAPVVKNIPNEIPVRMRLEESYDTNGNRKLETPEIKTLLKFVIGEVKAKGKYPVNSDLLSIHDANQDGVITSNELAPFEAFAK